MTGPLRNPNAYRSHEIRQMQSDNSDLREEVASLRKFVQALDSLYDASDNFKDDSELMPFLRSTLQHAMKLLNAPDGTLALLDEDTDELVFVIVLGKLGTELEGHRLPIKEGIAGWVVRNAKPALVRDARLDPRFYGDVDEDFTYQTQSIMAAPLVGNRKVYGMVELLNEQGDKVYDDKDLALLKLLCRAAGEALAVIAAMPEAED